MGKQATAEKRQKQYLDVKYNLAPDGELSPFCIDSEDGEEYPIAVIRKQELELGAVQFVVKVAGQQMYLYHDGGEWYVAQ